MSSLLCENKRAVSVNIENEAFSPLIYHKSIIWLIKEWCTPDGNCLSVLM
jgi:hypothetical protein